MSWIDAHCHLDLIDDGVERILSRARKVDVRTVITVGIDLETSRKSIELADRSDHIFAAVGIHPHDASKVQPFDFEQLEKVAQSDRVVAIGEIGLDYYRMNSPRETQIEIFKLQLELAKRLDLAVVLHVRDSYSEIFEVLESVGPPQRLVFHCFSGGPDEAAAAAALGGYISFAGNISFKSGSALREAAKSTPRDRLLVETDSPYLSPEPLRGRPNEPANVVLVGRALASAIGADEDEMAETTSSNARVVFGLPAASTRKKKI